MPTADGLVTDSAQASIGRDGRDRGRGQVAGIGWSAAEAAASIASNGGDSVAGLRDAALLRVMSDGLLRISEASALQVVRRGSDRRRRNRHHPGLEDRPAGGRRGAVPRRSHGPRPCSATSKPPASPTVPCSGGSARAARSPPIGLGADSIRAIVRKRAAAVDGITGRIGGHSLRVGSARELAADRRVPGRAPAGGRMALAHHAGGLRPAGVRHARPGRSPAVPGRAVGGAASARGGHRVSVPERWILPQ